jgi:hypothetical protein
VLDTLAAIKSFIPGSVGENDSLRPQNSKTLTPASAGDGSRRLLVLLTKFTNLSNTGRMPVAVQLACGVSLCALNKNDDCILPVALCCTSCSLIAKAALVNMAASILAAEVGFGVPQATEDAAHAGRSI